MTRIVTSLHGQKVGLTQDGRLMVPAGLITGEHGSQMSLPSPSRVAFFKDFEGAAQTYSTTVVDGLRSRKGSDGACVDWTVTPAIDGTAVGTIGNTTASMAVSGTQLDAGLSWKANQGDLVLQARVKLSVITNIAAFIGFTDQTGALEMPINSAASADTFTTTATDAVGFMFDTSMTTDTWWLTGVANDVDATHQNSAAVPVAATYQTFRIEVAADGSAVFFINGVQVGTKLAAAVTATVALTPVIAGFNRTTTGAPTITADYLAVSGLRV
jgi:hypothetical protein